MEGLAKMQQWVMTNDEPATASEAIRRLWVLTSCLAVDVLRGQRRCEDIVASFISRAPSKGDSHGR